MNQSLLKLIKYARYPGYVILALAAIFLVILIYLGFAAREKPDIQTWHKIPQWEDNLTKKEYPDFKAYLTEEKKFLDDINRSVELKEAFSYNRYAKDNLSSPYVAGKNLNASFEFSPDGKKIQGGILLVHGLTDSPYHLKTLGHLFADSGYYVIGLRLPGHGTVPGALLDVCWEDWYAAVQFGARMVLNKIENAKNNKFYIGGFSTGGALTLRYVLDAVSARDIRLPDKLLLLSPVISVDPLSAFMDWHHIISWISYFEKFKWLEIKPEYDPFKYNSFAKNAADQIFDLTKANWELIDLIAEDETLRQKVPPIYAFQSRVDATVKTEKLLDMFTHIASDKSELMLFDINRVFETAVNEKLKADPLDLDIMKRIRAKVMVVTNKAKSGRAGYSKSVLIKTLHANKADTLNGLDWPENIFALSHVCIPISPDDEYYGRESILGGINIKGEQKVLLIGDDLSRLRYNPLFDLVKISLEVSFFNPIKQNNVKSISEPLN